MASILVYEDDRERASNCASLSHNWRNQPEIFGQETEKVLEICTGICRSFLRGKKEDRDRLLNKLFGIAKAHGLYVTWYGTGTCCQPDRFLVSGRGQKALAFIQV